MALAIDQLPDDVATLKRLLVERDAEMEKRRAELEVQRGEVLAARLLIEKLKLQIARLRRIQFGRRSEQHDARVVQLELIVEELETSLATKPAAAETAPSSSPRTPPVRRPLPAMLPRETKVHAAATFGVVVDLLLSPRRPALDFGGRAGLASSRATRSFPRARHKPHLQRSSSASPAPFP